MPAAHAIYADELIKLGHGYPLWEPECKVSIGDVGYIRDGRFYRLFNALLPPGDSQNNFGEPKGFQPLQLDEHAMMESTLSPGPMYSRSITNHGADVGALGTIIQAGLGFKFSRGKDQGAILIIKSEARRKHSEQRDAFTKYMRKYYKSWLNFANIKPNYRGISLSDLSFVTGHVHTADWAVAAFSENTASSAIRFQAGFPNIASANFSIWGSWLDSTGLQSHSGPRRPRDSIEQAKPSGEVGQVCAADLGKYDQCIFVQRLTMMDRLSPLKKFKIPHLMEVHSNRGVQYIGEPESSGGSMDWDGESLDSVGEVASVESKETITDVGVSLDHVEAASVGVENQAAVGLLEYILQQNPEADVAFVHDDDLAVILVENDSLNIDRILNGAPPPVVVDSEGVGTVSLTSQTSRPPPSD